MKIVSPKPTCADRYHLRLLAPTAFDGNVIAAGGLVEVSDAQAVELIMHERAEAALPAEVEAAGGGILIVRPRAILEFPDESMTPRQRKKWRPSRMRNRMAQPGSVRLDDGASIVDQVNRIVGR